MALDLARLRTVTLDRARVDPRRMLAYSWAIVAGAGLIAFTMLITGFAPVPSLATMMPPLPPDPVPAMSSRILDVNGKLIARLHGEEDRIVVRHTQIPKVLRSAVLAVEDHNFFEHGAVAPAAVARALLANMAAGRIQQGGSTITQQYVRNAFREVGRKRDFARKVKEAMIAIRYEENHSKTQILDKYLNTVYFGRGAYGVEAAARAYFGKPARKVTLSQAAFLAGAIQRPELYVADRAAARKRRDFVLRKMLRHGFIDARHARAAMRRPLRFHDPSKEPVRAAYFVEFVRRQLLRPTEQGGFGFSDRDILTGGLNIHTTLDLRLQDAAERAVRTVLYRDDDPEAAIVGMTTSGEVRAMVGGRDFTSIARARGFNFATQMAPGGGRQPGSAFKPFTLAAYVRAGYSVRRVFPAPSRVGVPQCDNPDHVWTPANYGGQGYGALSVVQATEKSVNTVYAQMVALVGPAAAMEAARDAGITSDLAPVCSIALGTFGVTPLEMARAYATFAARGARPEVTTILKVTGHRGRLLAERAPASTQTIEPHVADVVGKILESVIDRGTGTPARISRAAAGKTGTTEEHRDVWFAGYTPHPGLSAAVWIGNPPDRSGYIRPMRSIHGRVATGGYFAGGIWRLFMEEAMKGTPERAFPEAEFSGVYGPSLKVLVGGVEREGPDSVTVTATPTPAPPPKKKKKQGHKPPSPSPTATPTSEPSAEPSPT